MSTPVILTIVVEGAVPVQIVELEPLVISTNIPVIGPRGPKGDDGPSATQVQADWDQADTGAVDFIKNKPTDFGSMTGQEIVAALHALPLNEMLTALDTSYNGTTLKEFLDTLTGVVNGNLTVDNTYEGVLRAGTILRVYDDTGVLVATYTTNDTAILFESLPVGVYSIVCISAYGTMFDSITVVDSNAINDTQTIDTPNERTLTGVNINASTDCVITITLKAESAPIVNGILINGGAAASANETVTVSVDYVFSLEEYQVSESPTFVGANWAAYGGDFTYFKDYISAITLTLYFKGRNTKGESGVVSSSINMVNGFTRSDSAKTYATMHDAVADIVLDYETGGISALSEDVTLTCIAEVLETRTVTSYETIIEDFNKGSQYILTINGAGLLTVDCASLGGIKIKNSEGILIKDIVFTNVATQANAASPDELAAIFVQGSSLKKCANIVVDNCIFENYQIYNYEEYFGSYCVLAKFIDNFTVMDCSFLHFAAVALKCSVVQVLNFNENFLFGSQVDGIVSQPTHLAAGGCNILNITGNEFDGTSFDTGMILDAVYINVLRNKFHHFNGEICRIQNTAVGVLFDFSSNITYQNLLAQPYAYTKNQINVSANWGEVRLVSNTIEMRGINTNISFESYFKGYLNTITKFVFSNNIVWMNYINYPNNTCNGRVVMLDTVGTMESANNKYLDVVITPNVFNTVLYTVLTGVSGLNTLKSLTTIQSLGYEIGSTLSGVSLDMFVSKETYNFNLTANGAVLAAATGGQISNVDYTYKVGSSVSGAIGSGYSVIDETSLVLDFDTYNLLTGLHYHVAEQAIVNSSSGLYFAQLNKNRLGKYKWIMTNTGNIGLSYMLFGSHGLISLLSNVDGNGLYTTDAIYDVDLTIVA